MSRVCVNCFNEVNKAGVVVCPQCKAEMNDSSEFNPGELLRHRGGIHDERLKDGQPQNEK
jgi:predicted amidophosphoribosyltransferase